MSNIFTGNKFKLFYNTDTGNRIPDNPTNVQIDELSALPTLTIRSSVQTIETYDSDYAEKLLSEQDVSNIDIQVNYIATDVSHKFLDNAATSQETFQLILQYVLEDNQLSYSTVNGSIAKTSLSGDKDSVITKTYSFVPTQMIARMALAEVSTPVVVGMYGLGANGDTVPQYQPLTPDGNAFVKIPAAHAGNPASADMMGVGLVDGTTYSSLAMTKSGTLSLYAKNANTAWTRILTAPQISAQYVPLTRTVNGKPLSANIVLDKSDVGLSNVTNDAQLKIASNLSDLASIDTARKNIIVDKLVQTSASTNLNYPTKNAALVLRDSDLTWGVFDNTNNQWQALGIGQGGTGSTTAAGARTNLGLGTAAVVNTGTSGNTIPLLSGTNAWSSPQAFNASSMSIGGTTTSTGVGLELGSTVAAGTSYIDFHSSGTTSDYDARISVAGGSATTLGKLTITASSLATQSLELTNDLAIAHGGTGASTFDQALINLNAMKFQRTSLGNSDNLNSYDGNNPGFFYCATNASATVANNYPVTQAGSLLVMRNGANGVVGCTQMYWPYNSNDIYVRTGFAGTTMSWSGWNILLQQGSFGVGAINTTRPADATNSFIADSDGATLWAPANGAGIQVSYANNRLFQFMMSTANSAYMRFNDTGNPQATRAVKPWTKLLTPGDYGLGADLTVNPSTPIANLNELTPTGFYYTTNESTLGGVTSDTTYVITNRGGRPTAHAAKYVQQRSWNGYYQGANGWAWREQAQLESSQTWSGANTFNGRVVVAAPAAAPFTLSSVNPCIQFNETDTASNYTMVADGGNWRMNLNNTGGANIINYDRAKNDLTLTSGSIVISGNAAGTSANVSTGGFRGIEPGLDYAGFDNMNNVNITSWYGIGFCTAYNIPTNGVVAGKPAVYINTRNGTLAAKNAVYANTTQLTSDRNAKDNIEEIPDDEETIEKILGLKTYTFNFKNSGQPSAGFIAQEVQEVFPDYVQFVEDINHYSLDYTAVNAYLHKAVVHYADKTKAMEAKVESQQAQIDELKSLVLQLLNKSECDK
ncbi:tail fiber domain-containing protein [Escherichia coli]